MTSPVTYRRDDAVAVITLDDGKANALGLPMLAAISDALDTAIDDDAGAVVLTGNHKVFSGGFDLKVFTAGDVDALVAMLQGGFELSHRLLSFPRPVVAACSGPAVAMGAFLLCSVDHRVAAPQYAVVANEVSIGMTMPYAALAVLQQRLTPPAFHQAVNLSRPYQGDAAVTAGFIDELVEAEQVLTHAIEAAREFTALHRGAHAASKLRARAGALAQIRAGIDNMRAELG